MSLVALRHVFTALHVRSNGVYAISAKMGIMSRGMLQFQFHDFDEFSQSVREVDCRMTPQFIQRNLWCIRHLDFGDARLQSGSLGSGNIVEGAMARNGQLLYIPFSQDAGYSLLGERLDKGDVGILRAGSEFCVSTQAPHNWATVFIPNSYFAKPRKRRSVQKPGADSQSPKIHVGGAKLVLLRQLVTRILHANTITPDLASSPASKSALADLMCLVETVVQPENTCEAPVRGRKAVPRETVLRRCRDFVEEKGTEPVLVGDMAKYAGISERTLRTVFKKCYGQSPVSFLQLRQLALVQKDLLASRPDETTVSSILVRHGVWEFGRFARRYAQHFAELPSQALHRRPTPALGSSSIGMSG